MDSMLEKDFELDLRNTNQILQNYQIMQWKHNYQHSQFQLQHISSIFISHLRPYQELKQIIELYNTDVSTYYQLRKHQNLDIPIRNGPFRSVLCSSIIETLKKIIISPDHEKQKKMLDKAYKTFSFYIKKNNQNTSTSKNERPKTGIPIPKTNPKERPPTGNIKNAKIRPTSGTVTTYSSRRPISGKVKVDVEAIKGVQSQYIFDEQTKQAESLMQLQKKQYQQKNRTLYEEYDTAGARIKQFKRKVLQYQIDDVKKDPKIVGPKYHIQKKKKQSKVEQLLINQQSKYREQSIQISPEDQYPIIEIDSVDSTPLHVKPYVDDFVQQRQLQNHQLQKFMREQHRFVVQINKNAQVQKQQQQLVMHMQKYAKDRSKLCSETNRRIESAKLGSKFQEMQNTKSYPHSQYFMQDTNVFQQNSQKNYILIDHKKQAIPQYHIQQAVDKTKLKNVIKAQYKNIKQNYEIQPKQKAQLTNVHSKKPRPFSAIISQAKHLIAEQQQQQAIDIKQRLAKYKINIPLQSVNRCIVRQKEQMQDKLDMVGGMKLLHNPFFKTGKKKKKKKKRK